MPNAARSCVPKCLQRARVAAAASNCHAGRCLTGTVAAGRAWTLPSGTSNFGGVELVERLRRVRGAHFRDLERARREIEPGEAGPMPARIDGHEQRRALGVEQVRVGDRARRDYPHHLALDRALARRRIADLLADRDRFAEAHQPGEILLDCVERHARHRDRRSRRLAARGQRDVEQVAARRASS